MDIYEEVEMLRDNLDMAREQGDPRLEAAALYKLGRIYLKEEVYDAVEEYWSDCEAVCRSGDLKAELAQVLLDLSGLALNTKSGDASNIEARYLEALSIYETLELLQGQARTKDRLGELYLNNGQTEKAYEMFRDGLELCLAHDDRIGGLYFLDQIIPILKQGADYQELDRAIRTTITLSEKIGDRERMALGLIALADNYQQTGDPNEAIPCLEMAHDIYLRQGREKEAEKIVQELIRLGGRAPSKEQ